MRFPAPRPRPTGDSTVPMINVVFLLLIFFMISSELTPPPPFEVVPPDAGARDAGPAGDDTLYVSAGGELAWMELRGEAVLPALGDRAGNGPLVVRADAAADAAGIAGLLRRLSELGVDEIVLATRVDGR